jgi:hypothetical protein
LPAHVTAQAIEPQTLRDNRWKDFIRKPAMGAFVHSLDRFGEVFVRDVHLFLLQWSPVQKSAC